MMIALMGQALRQTVTQWPRMLLALVLLAMPVAEQCLAASSALVDFGAPWVAVVLLSGACGADARSGFQRLVLSRPVSRFQYLVARMLAGAGLVVALQTVQIVLSYAAAMTLGADDAPGWRSVVALVVAAVAGAVIYSAYFTAASAVLPGISDVALLAILVIGRQIVGELLPESQEIVGVLVGIPLSFLGGTPVAASSPWAAVVVIASNAAVLVALGALLFNRRQIPGEARS